MPKGRTPLSPQHEMTIVAMIGRGDTAKEIDAYFRANEGRGVHEDTVYKVRKRNKNSLDIIREKMLEKVEKDALGNKTTANRTIGKELSLNERKVDMLMKLQDDYLAGDINLEEFNEQSMKIKRASLSELVGVSKEMHNQTTEEKPKGNPEDIAKLVEALNSGDEVKLQQIIWGGSSNDGSSDNGQESKQAV